jgi:hypothetical protein
VGYEQSAGGAIPQHKYIGLHRVGMAVDCGQAGEKTRLIQLLDAARTHAQSVHLWVMGQPFDETLRAIVVQLEENLDHEADAQSRQAR